MNNKIHRSPKPAAFKSSGAVASHAPSSASGPHGGMQSTVPIDSELVERFSRLMASREWPVESPRMLRDSAYAYKRIAIGLSSGDAALRALSVRLYEGYQALARRRQRSDR